MRKRGDSSRLKSTQINLNAPEMNIYNVLNVARKDEGERAGGQVGRPAPPCQVWPQASGIFLLGLSIFGHVGVLVQKRKEKHEGEKERH